MRWRHYILAAGIFLSVALATVAIQIEGIRAGFRLDESIVRLQRTQEHLDALDLELQKARSPEAVRAFFRSRLNADPAGDPIASLPTAAEVFPEADGFRAYARVRESGSYRTGAVSRPAELPPVVSVPALEPTKPNANTGTP
jgi:hypothetical protein